MGFYYCRRHVEQAWKWRTELRASFGFPEITDNMFNMVVLTHVLMEIYIEVFSFNKVVKKVLLIVRGRGSLVL